MHISAKKVILKHAITHQLKAFKISLNVLNRINKVKFCSIRINVTKFDVTFATKEVGYPSPPPPVSTPLTGTNNFKWL